jgi:hypothetical protein
VLDVRHAASLARTAVDRERRSETV